MVFCALALLALLRFQSCQAPDDGAVIATDLATKCLATLDKTATQLGECRQRLSMVTPCPDDGADGS